MGMEPASEFRVRTIILDSSGVLPNPGDTSPRETFAGRKYTTRVLNPTPCTLHALFQFNNFHGVDFGKQISDSISGLQKACGHVRAVPDTRVGVDTAFAGQEGVL